MKSIASSTVLALLFIGAWAKPVYEDSNYKPRANFVQADCGEKFKFKHLSAKCFTNENGEFVIMSETLVRPTSALNEEGKVEIRRLKRSAAVEEDLRAEVLSARELKDLLKQSNEVYTESPLSANEESTSPPNDNEDKSDRVPIVGIIFVISTSENESSAVDNSNDTTVSAENPEDEMGEALFALLLLGAILEEAQKHQI